MTRLRTTILTVAASVLLPSLLLAGSTVTNTMRTVISQATGQLYGLEQVVPCSGPLSIGATSPTPDCGTWEWVAGDGSSPANIQGVTAQGLLAGALASGSKHSVAASSPLVGSAAADAANAIIERLDADPTLLPYSQSVEFLSSLATTTGYAPYQAKAEEYYGRVMTAYPTGADLVAHYLARNSLAGWDIASQIRAAAATGNTAFATEMVTALSGATWAGVPYGGRDYTQLSYGSLIWALSQFQENDWKSWRKALSWNLLANQAVDGSWKEDLQTTAYALVGLSLAPTVSGPSAKTYGDLSIAVADAAQYLLYNRDANGIWGYQVTGANGAMELVYPEVVAECVNALSLVKTGGLKLPSPTAGGGTSAPSSQVPVEPMR